MNVPIQLDFFRSEEEVQLIALKNTLDKVRKGTYARLNELANESADLKTRLEIIEKNICYRGNK